DVRSRRLGPGRGGAYWRLCPNSGGAESASACPLSPTTDSLFSDRRDCCYGSGQISWRANGGSHAAGYAVREERRCARCVSGVWRWSDQSGYGSRVRIEYRKLLGPTRLGSLSESIG